MAVFRRFLITLVFGVMPFSAMALNVQNYRPGPSATKGHYLQTSDNLPKGAFDLGTSVFYANEPIQARIAGPGVNRIQEIVGQLITGDFYAYYGIFDWWSVGVELPVNFYRDVSPVLYVGAPEKSAQMDMGDVYLETKIQAFDAEKTASGLGLAAMAFFTFPTEGQEFIFFSNKSVTGGLTAVFDGEWADNRIFINAGARLRAEKEVIQNLSVSHELLYGVGFQRPIWKRESLDFIAEIYGSTPFDQMFENESTSPVEALFTVQKRWLERRQVVTYFASGVGITDGYGAPTYRLVGGLSYIFNKKRDEAPLDRDRDGLSDEEELRIYNTDPKNPDTDGDGCKDGEEIYPYRTDPLKAGDCSKK